MSQPSALAGVLAARGVPARRPDADRAVAALGPDGVAGSTCAGALAVAWTAGVGFARHGDTICLLEGDVHALGAATVAAARAGQGSAADPPTREVAAGMLAAAFPASGERVLDGLRGEVAVVLWEAAGGAGLLARDQVGIRSLVWTREGDRLLFATELRHLLRLMARRPAPDAVAVARWLAGGPPPGERTMFAGVRELRPGCLLALDHAAGPRPYWRPRYTEPVRVAREEAVGEVRAALQVAVRRRLPAAVLLSGGLDSTTVAALAVLAGERPPAYSVTFPAHPDVDEEHLIVLLEDRLGLRGTHQEARAGSVLRGAVDYVRHWSLPSTSPNLFFWLPLLRRAAQDGVGAVLDGEGGDELFGLSPSLMADRLRAGRLRDAATLMRRVPGMAGSPSRRSVATYAWRHGVHPAFGGPLAPTFDRPPWVRRPPEEDAPPEPVEGPRWFRALVAATIDGPGPALSWSHLRRRSALAGLAVRHPLLDLDLLELMLRLPPELGFDNARSRPLLRDAMAGLLPEEIRTRTDKSLIDRLFLESLAGSDLPVARELLGPGARSGAYVDVERARAHLLAPAVRRDDDARTWGIHLWRLLGLECWLREEERPGSLDAVFAHHGAHTSFHLAPGG